MNDSRSPLRTDLLGRRRRLGATRRAMAAGMGLRIDQVAEIEEGTASDELRNLYAQWLDRLEAWPADKRASQMLAAEESRDLCCNIFASARKKVPCQIAGAQKVPVLMKCGHS